LVGCSPQYPGTGKIDRSVKASLNKIICLIDDTAKVAKTTGLL
jgi:hypothetical protein